MDSIRNDDVKVDHCKHMLQIFGGKPVFVEPNVYQMVQHDIEIFAEDGLEEDNMNENKVGDQEFSEKVGQVYKSLVQQPKS